MAFWHGRILPATYFFRRRGIVFVDDVNEVPIGGIVVYSAHGISPEVAADFGADVEPLGAKTSLRRST